MGATPGWGGVWVLGAVPLGGRRPGFFVSGYSLDSGLVCLSGCLGLGYLAGTVTDYMTSAWVSSVFVRHCPDVWLFFAFRPLWSSFLPFCPFCLFASFLGLFAFSAFFALLALFYFPGVFCPSLAFCLFAFFAFLPFCAFAFWPFGLFAFLPFCLFAFFLFCTLASWPFGLLALWLFGPVAFLRFFAFSTLGAGFGAVPIAAFFAFFAFLPCGFFAFLLFCLFAFWPLGLLAFWSVGLLAF